MSLTQLFQHRETPDSEKVLRRMLQPDGEIWYWDPSSNVVDKRAAKRPKKDEKKEKRSEKKLEKQLRKEEKKRQKQERQAEYSNNRKALTTSDDICWRKAEINRTSTKRDDAITLGNPTEAIENTLGIKFVDKKQAKLKTYPLHHSISFTNVFRRSKDSSSSASSDSSDSDSDSDDTRHSMPRRINRLRLISLRHGNKPPTSPSTTSAPATYVPTPSPSTTSSHAATSSSSTTSSCSTTSPLDSTLSASTCSSTTSSANNSPLTSPRSPAASPRANAAVQSPAASPRTHSPTASPRHTTARMKLNGLRKNLHNPITVLGGPTNGPNCHSDAIIEVTKCPTPLSMEPDGATSNDELELRSIDELTDDSSNESGFWVRERFHRPPSSRIAPTPYFDMILKSFDECL